ncbi:MAG: hypothetical protein ACI8RZ_001037 [Myxococcota bacterium]|jgi:hypothetical protein
MTIHRLGLIAAMIFALSASSSIASTTSQGTIYTSMTGDETAAFLEGEGLTLTRKTAEDGRPIHVFELNGVRTSLYHYSCSTSGECKALQIYIGLSMTNKPSQEKINEWNRGKRFARAYLDSVGDPCLEIDLDLEGGVSAGAVKELIRTSRISSQVFMEHVGFQLK